MRPLISVIIPCRNEVRFLGACLDSILDCDYPADRLEVLVADGMSTDGTRELVENYHRRYERVTLVDNPARITPAGLNRALEASSGEIIVRLDAHSTIAPDYLERAVAHLERDGADNVGGAIRTVARDRGPFAKSIRVALAHPFGVGNSRFRTHAGASPQWVDTVFGGCWRREVFERVGKFNEQLARGQDLEFNLRLAQAGGRILLAPDMRSCYFARATLRDFVIHNWTNGVWAILPFAYSTVVPVRWRHLIPLVFASALLGSVAAAAAGWVWLPAVILGPYALAALAASVMAAARGREARLLFLLPPTFASLHLSYGAGSLWGVAKLLWIVASRGVRGRTSTPALLKGTHS